MTFDDMDETARQFLKNLFEQTGGQSSRSRNAEAEKTFKLISWNVNGLRAVMQKDFMGSFSKLDADLKRRIHWTP
jgi:hypothetical protein